MPRYTVPFNKHRYSDNSDTPKQGSMIVRADSTEDAGHVAQAKRNATDTSGVRTPRGNRYYIGIIHYSDIRRAKR